MDKPAGRSSSSRLSWLLIGGATFLFSLASLLFYGVFPHHLAAFILACLAIIPAAYLLGSATETLAHTLGSGIGGIVNATMGNAAELIIGIVALKNGNIAIVQASLTGSIIGNILFVLGLSALLGGFKYGKQKVNPTAASASFSMMLLSVCALAIPALFHLFIPPERLPHVEHQLGITISAVLLILYACSLLFSLKTHRHLYNEKEGSNDPPAWTLRWAIIILIFSTVFIAVMAEILIQTLEEAITGMGLTETFVGVVIIAIIGNAAEHGTAVLMALKNRMNLAFTIALESSKQIALFVAPVLVFTGIFLAPKGGEIMSLDFNPMEVIAVTFSVFMVASIGQDGETNWLEGALLLGVYTLLATGFFFIP